MSALFGTRAHTGRVDGTANDDKHLRDICPDFMDLAEIKLRLGPRPQPGRPRDRVDTSRTTHTSWGTIRTAGNR